MQRRFHGAEMVLTSSIAMPYLVGLARTSRAAGGSKKFHYFLFFIRFALE